MGRHDPMKFSTDQAFLSRHVTRSIALGVTLGLFASSAAAENGRHAVTVLTDAGEPVPGAMVSVSQLGLFNTMMTDTEGDTVPIERELQAPTVVRLDEALTTAYNDNFPAMTIGQHFTYVPDDSESTTSHRLTYFQPLARQLQFDQFRVTDDLESGWTSLSAPGATYDFDAYVAELKTNDVISNYFAFKMGLHVGHFQHGILIRTDDWVELDALGMYFNVDSKGYTYGSSGPQVHVFSMEQPGFRPQASATVHQADGEDIEFLLSGFLAPGDNLILFQDPAPKATYPADDLGMEVGLSTADPDCVPVVTNCSGIATCSPSAPKSYATGSAITCTTGYVKIGSQFNVGCGSRISEKECTSYKGGVSFGGSIGVVDVTASGEITHTDCLTVTVLGGYRGQGYRCFKACSRDWEWPARTFFGRDYTAHDTTKCSAPGETGTATCKTKDCD